LGRQELRHLSEETFRFLNPGEVAGAFEHNELGVFYSLVQAFGDDDRTNPAMPSNKNKCLGLDLGKVCDHPVDPGTSLWARRYSVASKSRSAPVGPQVICRARWLRANLTRDADQIDPRLLTILGLLPGAERQRGNTEIGTGDELQDCSVSIRA
jgi:hypothetical protein